MELKKEAIRGVQWTSVSTGIVVGIQLLQIAVLARILDIEDYGLMALAHMVMGFASIFLDMGISYAVISRDNVTPLQLSSLFWLNIGVGLGLFIMVALLSPLLADFYREQELAPIIILTATSFIISSLSILYYAILTKELRFNLISVVTVCSQLVMFVVSTTLALLAFKVYALVYGYLAAAIVNSILLIFFGLKYHRPSFYFSIREIKGFLSFGFFQMGESTLNYFNAQFDVMIIGRCFGPEVLGYYTLAKNLTSKPIEIINPIITKVTTPIMARVQHDREYLKKIYTKTLEYICAINFPIYALFVVLAEPIILFIYGPKWAAAIPLIRLLSVYFLIRSTFNPIGSLIIARDKANWGFYWNLAQSAITPICLWLGSQWGGVEGIVITLICIKIALVYPLHRLMISALIPISFYRYLKIIFIPLTTVAIAALPCIWLRGFSTDMLIQLGITSSLFGMLYFLFVYALNRPLLLELKNFRT